MPSLRRVVRHCSSCHAESSASGRLRIESGNPNTRATVIAPLLRLAVARGMGETAPILLTALGNEFINTNPLQPTDAVPLRIYKYARTPVLSQHTIAWGGAIVLLAAVLLLSITARVLANRQQRRVR